VAQTLCSNAVWHRRWVRFWVRLVFENPVAWDEAASGEVAIAPLRFPMVSKYRLTVQGCAASLILLTNLDVFLDVERH
jgi:hypothetical protein